ncbi:MAG TPA: ethanolamine ammonia-lyase subunit EutC [Terriglobales bacterium]|nr:ethanolamine ammonia-lyase subunit EutC [Terriglobales bacterium]
MPDDDKLVAGSWPGFIAKVRARTPARVLTDRAGAAYRTITQLELRHAHAAARDAVCAEFDLERDLGAVFLQKWKLFSVSSQAGSKEEYLLHPDLGRKLSDEARQELLARCKPEADLQIVIGDGLSVTAVAAQVPRLLPLIMDYAGSRGWREEQPFAVRYCRVGIMNDLGDLLRPRVVVLLIGERPGLSTAESLSAYMAFRPRAGHSDANRNLISNIHSAGVPPAAAAGRIIALAEQMLRRQISGVELKEQMPAPKWLKH